jgi:uncharacterized membrane protein
MGKRSRKRTGSSPGATTEAAPSGGTTRAERDAARARRAAGVEQRAAAPARARRRRPGRGERPPAPWGSFPLVELCVLIGIVLLIAGFFVGQTRGATMIMMGLALGSLGGLELSIREHFAGYRSHTILLAGAVAVLVGTVVAVAAGKILLPVLVAVAAVVFGVSFYLFRRVFRRRTGGVSFR